MDSPLQMLVSITLQHTLLLLQLREVSPRVHILRLLQLRVASPRVLSLQA